MKLATHNSLLKWTLLAALPLSATYGAGQTAVLRAVSVSGETIRLSDLLPPETANTLRRAGEQIDLGRTPQCHTIRFFEPSDIEKRISSSPLWRGLALAGSVAVQRTCFPIRREAVERLISEFVQQKDVALAEPSLQWSDVIYASKDSPVLEIEQALPDPVRPALQIRLRCVERAVCPSFWVSIPTKQRPHLSFAAAPTLESAPSPVLVKVGERVMLVFDDPPMRMQLWVTCLQPGSLGKQVRAMDPATHRVFQAEVTGTGTLMAHL